MITVQIIKRIQENWKYLFLSIVIALFLISFSNAQAAAADLNVTLSYREMIALGPDADVRLMIVDPTETEDKLIIRDLEKKLENGVPVGFNLSLSEQEIEADKNYQLLGVINWQGDMIWAENKRLSGSELLESKNINMITKRTPSRLLTFKGEKDFEVRFFNSMAQLIIEDEEYILAQQRTASGAKFTNSELSIWNKGREITLEKDGNSYQSSLISLADINSAEDTVEIRGQEPYWEVKIDKNALELKYDYLTNRIRIPMSNVEIIEKTNSLSYQINTSFLDFEVKLLNDIHSDQMNGKIYPLTAFIKINGEKYIGGADLN